MIQQIAENEQQSRRSPPAATARLGAKIAHILLNAGRKMPILKE
jgi:hypothetical protein